MTTIKDIAELSNCSYTTVSLVLNGKGEGRISTATRERVLASARQLNYVPNIAAKRLKSSSEGEYNIAAFWPADYRISYISRMVMGLKREIDTVSERVNISICPYYNDELKTKLTPAAAAAWHGAIIAAASPADQAYVEGLELPIPIVLTNRESSRYSTVGCDNYAAGKMAARHLIQCGYTHVSTVFSGSDWSAKHEHRRGFLETWEEAGGLVAASYTCADTVTDGYRLAEKALQEPLPEAFFLDSDAVARGFLCGASASGCKVPEETAVLAIGQYTPESSAYTVPPLTTVEIPHELFAEQALHILLSNIRKDMTRPCHIIYDAALRIRASCP